LHCSEAPVFRGARQQFVISAIGLVTQWKTYGSAFVIEGVAADGEILFIALGF